MKSRYLSLIAACLLCGCAERQFGGSPNITVVNGSALPPPTDRDTLTPPRPYLVSPYDRVEIAVFGIPELSKTVQVDAAGEFSLPLVGVVQASGKSAQELSDYLTTRLKESYVRDPQVSVNVTETVSQVFTVDGSVETPGQYPIVGRMTLMRAIAKAGSTSEFARENYVVVFRRVDGKSMAALYDLRAIRQGVYEDPPIYANDVISVGDSRGKRVFRDVLQASGLLTAPLIAILQRR